MNYFGHPLSVFFGLFGPLVDSTALSPQDCYFVFRTSRDSAVLGPAGAHVPFPSFNLVVRLLPTSPCGVRRFPSPFVAGAAFLAPSLGGAALLLSFWVVLLSSLFPLGGAGVTLAPPPVVVTG